MNTATISPVRAYLFIALLGCSAVWLLYHPTLDFLYIWDDTLIRQFNHYDSLHDIVGETWKKSFLGSTYFRPLPVLSMILETRSSADSAAQASLGHLINLVCSLAAVLLLASVLLTAPKTGDHAYTNHRYGSALLLCGIFITHPALMVGIAWVSARFDLAVTLFALCLLWCDSRIRHHTLRATMAGAAFLLAALCKEMAVVLALFLPLWHCFQRPAADRRAVLAWLRDEGHLSSYAGIIIAGLLYLALRDNALGTLLPHDPLVRSIGTTTLEKALYIGKSFAWYIALECWPFVKILPAYFQSVPLAHNDLLAWSGLSALVFCITAGAWMLTTGWRRAGSFLLALVALNLPIINIAPLNIRDNIVELRLALLPATLLLLMAGHQWLYWQTVSQRREIPTTPTKTGPLLTGAAIIWILFGVLNVTSILPLWRNDLIFWTWYKTVSPRSDVAAMNYCYALKTFGRFDDAITCSQQAMASDRNNTAAATYNIALSMVLQEKHAEALPYFLQLATLRQPPGTIIEAATIQAFIAQSQINTGQLEAAHATLLRAIDADKTGNIHLQAQLVRYGLATKDTTAVQQGMNALHHQFANPAVLRRVLLDHHLPADQLLTADVR